MTKAEQRRIFQAVGGLVIVVIAAWLGIDVTTGSSTAELTTEISDSTVLTPVEGTVTRVVDGDTLEIVLHGETQKVRLIGIDTPETVDPRKPVECFGNEASAHLKTLVDGQVVTVAYDATQGMTDKYGRILVYVTLADGTNVAEKMLRDGFAYEYTYNKPYELQKDFKNAEQVARDSETGLWSSESCGGKR